ncbi:hypothetical protein ACJZ2D_012290 [Fusarium nematophilum]
MHNPPFSDEDTTPRSGSQELHRLCTANSQEQMLQVPSKNITSSLDENVWKSYNNASVVGVSPLVDALNDLSSEVNKEVDTSSSSLFSETAGSVKSNLRSKHGTPNTSTHLDVPLVNESSPIDQANCLLSSTPRSTSTISEGSCSSTDDSIFPGTLEEPKTNETTEGLQGERIDPESTARLTHEHRIESRQDQQRQRREYLARGSQGEADRPRDAPAWIPSSGTRKSLWQYVIMIAARHIVATLIGVSSLFSFPSLVGDSVYEPSLDPPVEQESDHASYLGKRQKDHLEDETVHDDGHGQGQRPSKRAKSLPLSSLFMCPFFKHNRQRYQTSKWRSCCEPREHIYRRHLLPKNRCGRCWQPFKTEHLLFEHQRAENPCHVVPPNPEEEGVNDDQEKLLRVRSKNKGVDKDRQALEEEKWTQVYQIIFPHDEPIPSPYLETSSIEPNDLFPRHNGNFSEQSRNNFEDEFERLLRLKLDNTSEQALHPDNVMEMARSTLRTAMDSCRRTDAFDGTRSNTLGSSLSGLPASSSDTCAPAAVGQHPSRL